METEIY